jgi:hypothetical protein
MEQNPRTRLNPFGMIKRNKNFFDKSQEIIDSFRNVDSEALQEKDALPQKAEEE